MEHQFNTTIAERFGIEEAIIIHNLFHWISKNAANGVNMHEGLYWTFNSIKAYSALFPYMSETKVKRVFKNLEENGLIVKGRFGDDKWNQTNWYSFNLETLNLLENVGYDVHWVKMNQSNGVKCTNRMVQNDQMNNNIDNNTNYNTNSKPYSNKENDINKSISKRKVVNYDEEFEKAWKLYQRKGTKQKAYEYWKKLSDDEKEKVFAHIPHYLQSNEIQYLKDFDGYLHNRYFERLVYNKKGNLLFDPERANESAYNPICEGALLWDEQTKNYMYIGYWDGVFIPDGYRDDNRPNGAKVVLNNGRGTIIWDSETKKWSKMS